MEIGRADTPAKTQWVRVQAIEEVPGDRVWLAWRVRWHGMCGGQGIHMKGLKCQAESLFSHLKREGVFRADPYKDGTTWKAVSARECGGWATAEETAHIMVQAEEQAVSAREWGGRATAEETAYIMVQAEELVSCPGTPCEPPS